MKKIIHSYKVQVYGVNILLYFQIDDEDNYDIYKKNKHRVDLVSIGMFEYHAYFKLLIFNHQSMTAVYNKRETEEIFSTCAAYCDNS